MSGVFTNRFGRRKSRGVVREPGEELLELGLRVAPREVRVALLEPGQREALQRGGARERLGEEDDVRDARP